MPYSPLIEREEEWPIMNDFDLIIKTVSFSDNESKKIKQKGKNTSDINSSKN